MLRFNPRQAHCYGCPHLISIHLMLRFNSMYKSGKNDYCKFQYILCCGSTKDYYFLRTKIENISIHLMLRFNSLTLVLLFYSYYISIHLMLRFNFLVYCQGVFSEEISIHLMLRFNLCGYTFYFFHHIKKALKLQYFSLFFPMISAVWAKIKK